ncbi:hypothetical protein DQ04_20481000 [Trypanosoma grayi]|uniref:hypothetical protein n=1 Tax=Trypanosoma grayi TaxID=71804 RepID=UPI0004F49346|nr:hypothetical protein DQ04_20481000 [Trypanosoma grayi]KEG05562.1 hypothetical protein DQ04_20481000 [Trypanosoma grayi]
MSYSVSAATLAPVSASISTPALASSVATVQKQYSTLHPPRARLGGGGGLVRFRSTTRCGREEVRLSPATTRRLNVKEHF